jgi:hypothetical protein
MQVAAASARLLRPIPVLAPAAVMFWDIVKELLARFSNIRT